LNSLASGSKLGGSPNGRLANVREGSGRGRREGRQAGKEEGGKVMELVMENEFSSI